LLAAIACVAGTSVNPTAHATSHATVRRFLMSPIPLSGASYAGPPSQDRSKPTLTGYGYPPQGVCQHWASRNCVILSAWQG
jgi:hypothetical protein